LIPGVKLNEISPRSNEKLMKLIEHEPGTLSFAAKP